MFTTAEYNELIVNEFNTIRDLVVKKNTDYDSAVFKPIGVFTSTTALDQIKTRLDDKLKRLQHYYHNDSDTNLSFNEDTEADVIAYLVLKRVLEIAEAAQRTQVEHLRESSGAIELSGTGPIFDAPRRRRGPNKKKKTGQQRKAANGRRKQARRKRTKR